VLTADLERFVAFYRDVIEMPLLFEETTPAFRHAILRSGPSSWLHPDGIRGELSLIVDAQLREFHAPRPLSA